jgi:hypothetical protein
MYFKTGLNIYNVPIANKIRKYPNLLLSGVVALRTQFTNVNVA